MAEWRRVVLQAMTTQCRLQFRAERPEALRRHRALVDRVELARAAEPPLAIELWDFSVYHSFTTEAVPQPHERHRSMRWSWEAGHFKADPGEQVLARIFGMAQDGSDFGIRLERSQIDGHLARTRANQHAYALAFPAETTTIEQMVASARGQMPAPR